MDININFNDVSDIPSLINLLEEAFLAHNEESIRLIIDLDTPYMICPDQLALIVGIYKYLKYKNRSISKIITEPSDINKNNYVSRINFYREIRYNIDEHFRRRNSRGRFLEITHFTSSNALNVVNAIMRIIKNQYSINRDLLAVLNFCFWEIVDNVLVHAQSPIEGYTAAQYYPHMDELRLIVLDLGIGIYESMTGTEGSRYSTLSPKQAIEYCILKGISSQRGGSGKGLYYTCEFIRKNNGEFILYSKNNYVKIINRQTFFDTGGYWKGTLVYLKIKTNNILNLEDIYELFEERIPITIDEWEDFFE